MVIYNNGKSVAISVIIPSYKGSEGMKRALDSLCNQQFCDFEVIFVDDNGEGTAEQLKTEKVIDSFREKLVITYLKHRENRNGAAARNTGLAAAQGKYIAFLDDDDIYLKDRLKNAYEALEKNSEADLVFCGVIIQRNGKLVSTVYPPVSENIQKELLLNTSIFGTGSNIFFRRSVYEQTGGFNERYFRRQDNEFLLRALDGRAYVVLDTTDIVKCNYGFSNIPDYAKLEASNALYYEEFQHLINKLSEQEYREFKAKEIGRLFFCSMMKEKRSVVNEVKKELLKYRGISKKEKIQYMLSRISWGTGNLLATIQPLMSRLKNNRADIRIKKMMSKEILTQLYQYEIIS